MGEIKQYIDNPINIKVQKRIKKEINSERELILAQLKNVEKKEERIKMAYVDGIDSIEEYKHNKDIVEQEKKSLEERLNNIKEPESNNNPDTISENLRTLYDILTDDNIDMKKKYDIAHEIINKVEYSNSVLTLIFNEI